MAYDWLEELKSLRTSRRGAVVEDELELAGAAPPRELERLCEALKIPLPPSYRAFLERWNGGTYFGAKILSAGAVLAWHDDWYPFEPFDGTTRVCEPDGEEYYSEKPTHFLVIVEHPHGYDAECLDTARGEATEHPVVTYDAEDAPDFTTQAPTFEAWLMQLAWERTDVDSEAHQRLRELLERGGAQNIDVLDTDWSGWKGLI